MTKKYMKNCTHEDNLIYGELIQEDGEPQYTVSCADCKMKGIIYLQEIAEAWGKEMILGREQALTRVEQRAKSKDDSELNGQNEPLRCTHKNCRQLQTEDGEFCEKHYPLTKIK